MEEPWRTVGRAEYRRDERVKMNLACAANPIGKRCMRKFGKVLLVTVLVLLSVAFVFVGGVYALSARRLNRHHTVLAVPVGIPEGQGSVARGAHLVATRGCADCHGADLGGAKVVENPAIGRMHGPNLTKGAGGVTANYQEEDWVRSIRHGINPKGWPLVLMPSHEYAEMSDQDFADLIAYLKSVPPVDRETVPVSVGPVARLLILTGEMRLAAEVIDHTGLRPSTVQPGVTPEYGRYLAAGCTGCHGPNYSGGKIAGGPPEWPAASNLTAGEMGAMKNWTESDFMTALKTGHRPNGTEINPVMPRAFGKMTEEEMKALWS
ncbi:MAG: cytochrome c, partial [Verrucomicrobiaceae bacterium]